MKINGITEDFEKIEIYEKYNEYFCNVSETMAMKYLGIKKYSASNRVSEFLKKEFGINHIPC